MLRVVMPSAPETRAKLLAAARQAFADLGYGKARVEDVVARAGVGHGTFYAYFPNKRAALAALIHENAATLVGLASQPWGVGATRRPRRTGEGGAPGKSPPVPTANQVRESLVAVLGGLADLYDADADLIVLWTEASMRDPELGRVLDEVRRQFAKRVARNIERAAAQGLTRPVDAHTAATALAAMAEQTLFLRAVRKEPLDRDTTVQTLADLWYHALYREQPGEPGGSTG
jgi:AcrR family transcriptional regulator